MPMMSDEVCAKLGLASLDPAERLIEFGLVSIVLGIRPLEMGLGSLESEVCCIGTSAGGGVSGRTGDGVGGGDVACPGCSN